MQERSSSRLPPKVLVLTGASGSGKNTTLLLLCKEMNINVSEWSGDHSSSYLPSEMTRSSADSLMTKVSSDEFHSIIKLFN